MAGFKVTRDINDRPLQVLPLTSATYAAGDLVELVNGTTSWAKCTSSSNYFTRKAIVMEAGTSITSGLCMELNGTEEVSVESTNTANSAHNGDYMVLTDENTVNNTGTTSSAQTACFVQDGIGPGTTTIVGRVIVAGGVDPDAT